MTSAQILSFALIGLAVALFAWGRFRYDAISLGVLVLAVLTGDVDPKRAFEGFASDVVIIIASALVVSAAISRSQVIEPLLRPLVARLRTPRTQVPALTAATGLFAMITKNVGALATLMPVAIRMGRGKDSSPSALLMPMAFISLMGGLVTLVGTSTNIIASQVREQVLGKPFDMFDFAPVGLGLTAIGFVFLSFGWRLLPRDRQPTAGLDEVTAATPYVTEATIPEGWDKKAWPRVAALDLERYDVKLTGVLGANGAKQRALPSAQLAPGKTLLLQGDEAALGAVFANTPLVAVRDHAAVETEQAHEEVLGIEVVIESGSRLVGRTAQWATLQTLHGVKLLAISRTGRRVTGPIGEVRLRAGDLLLLQSSEGGLADALGDLGLLPLAERTVTIGDPRRRFVPLIVLALAIGLIAMKVLPVAIAFFAAAVAMVALGSLTMREAYRSLEPEVLVLIGALTPLAEAVQHNGGTALAGQALAGLLGSAAPIVVLGGMMLAAMACSPFLHNAPTVLVMAPLGVTLAQRLGLNPDAFLMAVATGAGCDFLTPVGHQCNTLVRGPGGYRFGDYWRLGLPLSVVVIFAGTPLIAGVWGLSP